MSDGMPSFGPSFDEMLAAKAWPGLYAALPGTGPAGRTCRSCAHKTYTGNTKLHAKCGLTKYTHGDATTIRTGAPACKYYHKEKK